MGLLYRLTVTVLRGCFHTFYRYRVYGVHSPYKGCAILAPNHASFLDPPLIGAAWPEEVHFLARASLFDYKVSRWLLPRLNAHPLQEAAQDIQSFRTLCQLLSEGKKVVIFPEGARTSTGDLQPIKPGVAMLALRMQCPIIPVYLHGTFEAWPRHSKWPKLGPSLTCIFGKPIKVSSTKNKNKRQLQEELTRHLQQSLENLRLWFDAGAQGEPP